MVMEMARTAALLVALLAVFSSDLCRAASDPSVLFFAEDALGPSDQDADVISPRGLAATAAVFMGLPTPSTTDASVAKEVWAALARRGSKISSLVSNPLAFSHTDRLLILTVEGAPSVSSDWLKGVSFGGQPGQPSSPSMKLVHARTLAASQDGELRRELTLMSRESGSAITPGWLSEPAREVGEVAWDSAVLGGAELSTIDEASVAAARNLLGQEFVTDVLEISELVKESRDKSSPPALLSLTLTMPAVDAGKEKAALKGLEGALATLLTSLQKAKSTKSGPLVAVVILKDKSAAALEQPGCQGTSCARGSRARVLVQESEEPAGAVGSAKEVVDQSVYFVVILVLLTAFIIGIVLLCGMHVTKDTLLYSGAKLD